VRRGTTYSAAAAADDDDDDEGEIPEGTTSAATFIIAYSIDSTVPRSAIRKVKVWL